MKSWEYSVEAVIQISGASTCNQSLFKTILFFFNRVIWASLRFRRYGYRALQTVTGYRKNKYKFFMKVCHESIHLVLWVPADDTNASLSCSKSDYFIWLKDSESQVCLITNNSLVIITKNLNTVTNPCSSSFQLQWDVRDFWSRQK